MASAGSKMCWTATPRADPASQVAGSSFVTPIPMSDACSPPTMRLRTSGNSCTWGSCRRHGGTVGGWTWCGTCSGSRAKPAALDWFSRWIGEWAGVGDLRQDGFSRVGSPGRFSESSGSFALLIAQQQLGATPAGQRRVGFGVCEQLFHSRQPANEGAIDNSANLLRRGFCRQCHALRRKSGKRDSLHVGAV